MLNMSLNHVVARHRGVVWVLQQRGRRILQMWCKCASHYYLRNFCYYLLWPNSADI